MNFFELHVGDYEAATAHLSLLEDGAYNRMLRIYYRTERPLPADLKQLCRLVRAVSKPEREAVQAVLNDFYELREDGWHQKRCDEELRSFHEREPEREAKKANEDTRLKRHREERAALFKALNDAGLHAPWNIKMEALRAMAAAAHATAPATQPETQLQPLPATAPATPATATHGNVPPPPTSHLPPPNIEKEKPPKPPKGGSVHGFPPGFEEFWAAYPKKVGKDAAAKSFAQRKVDAEMLALMLRAIAAQRESEQWRKDGGQFIPNPATWLNQGRWQDESPSVSRPGDDVFAGAM